jgi:hypothetical protein
MKWTCPAIYFGTVHSKSKGFLYQNTKIELEQWYRAWSDYTVAQAGLVQYCAKG